MDWNDEQSWLKGTACLNGCKESVKDAFGEVVPTLDACETFDVILGSDILYEVRRCSAYHAEYVQEFFLLKDCNSAIYGMLPAVPHISQALSEVAKHVVLMWPLMCVLNATQMAHASLIAAVLSRRLCKGGTALISIAVRDQARFLPLSRGKMKHGGRRTLAACSSYMIYVRFLLHKSCVAFRTCAPCSFNWHCSCILCRLQHRDFAKSVECAMQAILDTFMSLVEGMQMLAEVKRVEASEEDRGILGLARDYEGGFVIITVSHLSK